MKTIIIGFSKHRGSWAIGSDLIRWFMKTEFSHTYFKFKEDSYEDSTICHATGKGVNYMSSTTFEKTNQPVAEFELEISNELYQELLQDCHRYAGDKYGYFQNLGILVVRVLGRVGIRMNRNPINDGINCSEWGYYLLEEIDGKWTNTDPNLVAPDEVYNYLVGRNRGKT